MGNPWLKTSAAGAVKNSRIIFKQALIEKSFA
jgi:hypothetical protein